MSGLKKQVHYVLPVRLSPFRDEGPQGYLLKLAENNLLNTDELKSIGITFDYDIFLSNFKPFAVFHVNFSTDKTAVENFTNFF